MTVMFKEPPPLTEHEDGTIRISGTRVLLDVVVQAFRAGASAEQIAEQYPALSLADAYAVIGFYLRNAAAIDLYVAERRRAADVLWIDLESQDDARGIRDRLRSRVGVGR